MKLALIRALLAAVLSLWLTTSAWAGFNEGLAAYQRGDYETAFEEWLALANGGNADAQFNRGIRYCYLQALAEEQRCESWCQN